MVKTYSDLYQKARKIISAVEEPQNAANLARYLLCHISGKRTEQFLAELELPASEEICAAMDFAVHRLITGEPLAYILGEWDFYGLRMYVDRNVLIPRDDTCAVTELALKYGLFLDKSPRILDLCTGSGCIGLAIANRLQDARVTLADISKDALAVAKKNAAANQLSGRAKCIVCNALEQPAAFLGKFDMIVSNPPYITTEEMKQLDRSVKDYEPHLALHGGTDGLDFYRAIAVNYAVALKPGGLLAFEFGMGQGDAVCSILEQNGYTILERTRDYNDRERAVIARYQQEG